MKKELLVIGAGGFGRETYSLVQAINEVNEKWQMLGFIDDAEPEMAKLNRLGTKWLGPREALEQYDGVAYVLAISNTSVRRELVELAERSGLNPITLIHPKVNIGLDVQIASGCIINAGVSLTTNVVLGVHTQLNPGVLIGHDTEISDFVSIYPGATIGGNVQIGSGSTIGANATVLQGITIGRESLVGAGSVVTKPVADFQTVKGIPAR